MRKLLFAVPLCALPLLMPANATTGGLAATVSNVSASNSSASFNVYSPSGTLLRSQSYRLTNAGGNCCEVQVGVTPTGRILEFGGDYPFYSDDRGASWKRVSALTITGGEGSISAAPGGDIVGITWSPYVGDRLQSYKYTAATGQWETAIVPVHSPGFDRPWLSVVKGPISWAGGTAPYLTIARGGLLYGKEVEMVSFDGLNYVVPDSRLLDGLRNTLTPASAPLPTVADADLDTQQGPAPGAVAAIGAGRALRRVVSGDYSTCPFLQLAMQPDGSWSCLTLGGTQLFGTYRADSNGWLHEVRVAGSTVDVRTSTDGGVTWSTASATLPAGSSLSGTMPDIKADGVRKRLYVGLRAVGGTGWSGEQDLVLRFDYTGGVPSYAERWNIGLGNRTVGSSIAATGQRMDFTSLVVLPDGKVVTTFTDSTTGGSPSMAIQL